MRKEMIAGTGVVLALGGVFCGVLYQRVTKLRNAPAAIAKADDKKAEKKPLFGTPNKLAAADEAPQTETTPAPEPVGASRWRNRAAEPTDVAATETAGEPPVTIQNPFAAKSAPAEEPAAEVAQEATAPAAQGNAVQVEEETPAVVAAPNPFRRSIAAEPPMKVLEEQPAAQPGAADAAANDAAPSELLAGDNQSDAQAGPQDRLAAEDNASAIAATADRSSAADFRGAQPAARFTNATETPSAMARQAEPRYSPPSARSASAAARQPIDSLPSGKYTVGPNDTFWSIAERAYGSSGYFKALHAYNRDQHPTDELAVGDVISVPTAPELERQFPQLCPKAGRRPTTQQSYAMQASAKMKPDGKTYVVQEGDTLFDIARYELGKASRWAELYDLNRETIGNDIDFLHPGMELILPGEKRTTDAVTRQPGASLR